MAKLEWPPKKSFKYSFKDENELDFCIPLEETNKEKNNSKKEINNR